MVGGESDRSLYPSKGVVAYGSKEDLSLNAVKACPPPQPVAAVARASAAAAHPMIRRARIGEKLVIGSESSSEHRIGMFDQLLRDTQAR
jgi:hypothetical protein